MEQLTLFKTAEDGEEQNELEDWSLRVSQAREDIQERLITMRQPGSMPNIGTTPREGEPIMARRGAILLSDDQCEYVLKYVMPMFFVPARKHEKVPYKRRPGEPGVAALCAVRVPTSRRSAAGGRWPRSRRPSRCTTCRRPRTISARSGSWATCTTSTARTPSAASSSARPTSSARPRPRGSAKRRLLQIKEKEGDGGRGGYTCFFHHFFFVFFFDRGSAGEYTGKWCGGRNSSNSCSPSPSICPFLHRRQRRRRILLLLLSLLRLVRGLPPRVWTATDPVSLKATAG